MYNDYGHGLRLHRGEESITFTYLYVVLDRIPIPQFCRYNHSVLQSLIIASSSLPFVYGEMCCYVWIVSAMVYLLDDTNSH